MRHKCPRCGKYRVPANGAKIVLSLHPINNFLNCGIEWAEFTVNNLGYCKKCIKSFTKIVNKWWNSV